EKSNLQQTNLATISCRFRNNNLNTFTASLLESAALCGLVERKRLARLFLNFPKTYHFGINLTAIWSLIQNSMSKRLLNFAKWCLPHARVFISIKLSFERARLPRSFL